MRREINDKKRQELPTTAFKLDIATLESVPGWLHFQKIVNYFGPCLINDESLNYSVYFVLMQLSKFFGFSSSVCLNFF